jgi:hypothetical protein
MRQQVSDVIPFDEHRASLRVNFVRGDKKQS